MTDSNKDAPKKDDAIDNLDDDWAQAMSEQMAGTPPNQAQGLGDDTIGDSDPDTTEDSVDNDDWAAALAEQTAAQLDAEQGTAQLDADQSVGQADAGTDVATTASAAPELFRPLTGESSEAHNDIEMIMDIPVQMSVELGRTRLTIKNILQLGQGSVVELDGLAGEPMDIYVNGYLIAQGEVVVVDDKYGIRITDIITPSDRINRLNRR
ncbi:MAG TPA: flagellar motor switch protein FliN [Burkholderiaceae bacterium]|nr:flagellar motor switch protein FliN [Burkholderiaceae bacterium]